MISKLMKLGLTGASVLVLVSTQALADHNIFTVDDCVVSASCTVEENEKISDSSLGYLLQDEVDPNLADHVNSNLQTLNDLDVDGTVKAANDAQDAVRDAARAREIGEANTVQNELRDATRDTAIGDANDAQNAVRDTARDTAIGDANDAQNAVRDTARDTAIGDANDAQDIVRDTARTQEIDAANTTQDGLRDASRVLANEAQDDERDRTRKIANDAQDVIINTNTASIGTNRSAIARNAGNITDNEGGVAMAIALKGVDFAGTESFGIALNLGTFKDSNALALSVAGVLGRDIFGDGERLTVSGGAAFLVGGDGREEFAGRVGMQLTW